ncbi:MAG: Fic family protein, partial [Bacteroidia bacterium]
LIQKHYPKALVSHRTAIEFKPSPLHNVYLTSTQNRNVKWGEITLKFSKGKNSLESDLPLIKGLHVSSMERAYLENLTSSRSTGGELKTVDESIIEEKLLNILNTKGENGLNELRDKAQQISEVLEMKKEFSILNKKISAILSTSPSDILTSPVAMAQAFGEPYDSSRIELFQTLVGALRNSVFKSRSENATDMKSFQTFAFFESYFSNYIEGTIFEVQEAVDIVYNNKIIDNRVGDTHDVKGTFEVCSNKFEMQRKISSPNEFVDILKERHAIILRGRPDKNPGSFKHTANRAGNSHFVLPKMVKGTLKAGYEFINSIPSALGKAIYMMFLVSEVHPFDDGNGRIARIMMNAELVKEKEQRILIPTAYRDDYIGALKKLTKRSEPDAYIRMLDNIHDYSKWLNPSSFEGMLKQIKESNALEEPDEAKLTWKT